MKGATYAQIAATLTAEYAKAELSLPPKYGKVAAWTDVMAALKEAKEKLSESAALALEMELLRLDQLMLPYYTRAQNGDYAALDRVLSIIDRRARLLGLVSQPSVAVNATATTDDAGNVTAGVSVNVWLPDNGRGDSSLEAVTLPEDIAAQIGQPIGDDQPIAATLDNDDQVST
jgi:hypothetical protein